MEFHAPTPRLREHRVMQPDPEVSQQERDRHVQEPHLEPLRGRPDPALVHLAIARLDPEPDTVRLRHPVEPLGADPPVGVYPRLPAPLAMFPAPIPALDADPHRGLVLLLVAQRVLAPAAHLALLEDVRPTRSQRVLGRAAATDHGHQEWRPRPLEIADDLDVVEVA